MKIAILGAGAMGSIYGGFLSQNNEVWFVDVWKDHVNAINESGLTLTEGGINMEFHPKARETGKEVGPCDLVVVFVKSVNTAEAIAGNKELFDENTLVLSLQNGYGNADDMLKYVSAKNIVIGVTHHGGNVLGPGHVQINGRGKTAVGVVEGGDFANAQKVAQALTVSDLECEASQDAIKTVWSKVIANAALNGLTALLGVHNGYMLESPDMDFLYTAILKEGVAVANAEGMGFAEEQTIQNTKAGLKKVAANRSSMLQDVTNRRKTEVERINGAIVDMGVKHGIATPYNKCVTNLIKGLENAYEFSERFPGGTAAK